MNIYPTLAALLQKDGLIWLYTCLNEDSLGRAWLCNRAGQWQGEPGPFENAPRRTGLITGCDGKTYLCEAISAHRRLVVCGGGHISRPVCQLGHLLGYEVTVMDDRPEFANAGRFPQAKEVLCGPFAQTLKELDRSGDVSYVIVTRGHAADLECLREILQGPASYIGMIGSKTKIAAVYEALRQEGVDDSKLAQVCAPIGLAIGARTPEEIAVSIAAQLVEKSARENCGVLPAGMAEALLCPGFKGVMATVVQKEGSAPRGVGARMLFSGEEEWGTIGGGIAEHEICRLARQPLTEPRLHRFWLSNGQAESCGMVCGGSVTVLLQPIQL